MAPPRLWLPLATALVVAAPAAAQPRQDDPYAYDLRAAVFPAAFLATARQRHFGSAGRVELDLGRRVTVQVWGRGGWLGVGGEDASLDFDARAGVFIHLGDVVGEERLGGTVYPEDTPTTNTGVGRTTDNDLDVPVSQKLGGPRLRPPEKDYERVAPIRRVQSLRLGADYLRALTLVRGAAPNGDQGTVESTAAAAFVGYGWGTHFNLSAPTAGSLEVGFRRYYLDVLLTLDDWVRTRSVGDGSAPSPDLFPVGVRIGMEGTVAGLIESAPGVGLGYSLELGAVPGEVLEGYLLIGLGVALDFATGLRRARR
ncbi:MAG: hypothetical protein PVI30_11875 [Myxococcales bacterium]|jgi:hypothetical protein